MSCNAQKPNALTHTYSRKKRKGKSIYISSHSHNADGSSSDRMSRATRSPFFFFFFSNTYSIYILYTYLNIFCLHETPPPRNPGQRIHQMAPFTHKRKEKSIFFVFMNIIYIHLNKLKQKTKKGGNITCGRIWTSMTSWCWPLLLRSLLPPRTADVCMGEDESG